MTRLNDIPEDPTGFRIEPDRDTWRWVRISDEATRTGFVNRQDAIADAKATPREA